MSYFFVSCPSSSSLIPICLLTGSEHSRRKREKSTSSAGIGTERHKSTGFKSSSQSRRLQTSAVTIDDNDSKLPGKTDTPSSAWAKAAREFAELGNETRSKLGKDAGANIGSHMAGKYCRQYFGNTFQLFSLFSFNHSLIS